MTYTLYYATEANYTAYTRLPAPDSAAINILLFDAESDIDRLTSWGQDTVGVTGRIWDPSKLTTRQALALKNATCAQAEYRNEMGAEFFVEAQRVEVQGPDFKTKGKLPIYGPKVRRELSGSGLLPTGVRATIGVRRRIGW